MTLCNVYDTSNSFHGRLLLTLRLTFQMIVVEFLAHKGDSEMVETSSQLLSVVQAAARIGVSRFTLRVWLRQRRIPYVRLGRRVLIDPRDLERFIQAGRVDVRVGS